jgi:hypothetical protein
MQGQVLVVGYSTGGDNAVQCVALCTCVVV